MRWTTGWIWMLVVVMAGCGINAASIPPPPTIVVAGKAVQPGGQPITGGRIRFSPVEGAQGAEAYADIKPDGTFSLQSFGGKEGAIPGKYRVALSGKAMTGIDKKFQSPESSTKIVDITNDTKDLGAIKFQ